MKDTVTCTGCDCTSETVELYLCGRSYFRLPDGWFEDSWHGKICPECIGNLKSQDNESR